LIKKTNNNHNNTKLSMSEEIKLPGEKIAMIEEYLPGNNTFEDGDSIRATSVGSIEFNKSEQIVSVQ
jgi:exosome complex component CSL4